MFKVGEFAKEMIKEYSNIEPWKSKALRNEWKNDTFQGSSHSLCDRCVCGYRMVERRNFGAEPKEPTRKYQGGIQEFFIYAIEQVIKWQKRKVNENIFQKTWGKIRTYLEERETLLVKYLRKIFNLYLQATKPKTFYVFNVMQRRTEAS